MSKSKMPDSEPEYRFIFYTANLLLLALADLPLLIIRWKITASKLLNKIIRHKDKDGEETTKVISSWKSSKEVPASYPSIIEKLESIPAGFSPFAQGITAHTVLKDDDVLEFTNRSIDLKDYPDNPWKEIRKIDNRISRLRKGIIKRQEEIAQLQETQRKLKENDPHDIPSSQNKLWDSAELKITTPKIKSWWPKSRNNMVLVLESVSGSKAKARDRKYVWDLYDEIRDYGGSLARTPICMVVTFT